jgi:hypothetical protein
MSARFDPAFALELSLEEILEDLCWPHPPPGRWDLDGGRYFDNGRPTVSASRNGALSSAKRSSGSTPSALRPSERNRSTSS